MIQCKNISKSFNSKQVLKNVSMEIKNGEITALIGSNGAGKSTIINLITGYYHIDRGSITKQSISIMPDADTIYQEMTGYQFLKMMSEIKGIHLAEALSLSEKLLIKKQLDKKIEGYSFGMKKKIAFIQAFIGKYDTYIFDEPTSGVDGPSAKIMLNKVLELKRNNAGILLTSHNLDELERVADFIYIIESGRITRSGKVNDIILDGKNHINQIKYIIEASNPQLLASLLQSSYFDKEVSDIRIEEGLIFLEMEDNSKIIKEIMTTSFDNDISIHQFYKHKSTLYETVYG